VDTLIAAHVVFQWRPLDSLLAINRCGVRGQTYASSPIPEIAETCQIALDRLRWLETKEQVDGTNPYFSVDPAPPTATSKLSTAELQEQLLDVSRSLFDRYRALFTLRNRGDSASVKVRKRLERSCQTCDLPFLCVACRHFKGDKLNVRT
jgi:hypothetical protein